MKKKIIIRSIIATAILVGVSLTSVVGYQSAESNFNDSPLFNVRTLRAIKKDSNDATCNYIGKGELINLYFREVNLRIENILFNAINSMSDITFTRFVNFIIYHLNNGVNSQDVFHALKKIKDKPKMVRDDIILESYDSPQFPTGDVFLCTMGGVWGPGCYIWEIIDTIITIILLIPLFFYTLFCNINLKC